MCNCKGEKGVFRETLLVKGIRHALVAGTPAPLEPNSFICGTLLLKNGYINVNFSLSDLF